MKLKNLLRIVAHYTYVVLMSLFGISLMVMGGGLVLYGGFFYGYPFILAGFIAIPYIWYKFTHTNGKPWPKWLQLLHVIAILGYVLSKQEV